MTTTPARRALRPRLLLLGALLALVAAACGPSGDPSLSVGRAQAAVPISGSSQVVLAIENDGDGDDELLEVTTPAAMAVDIHLTVIEDGRASMQTQDTVEIPAGERVRFRPGGLHLMMVVPDETVVEGGTFELTLHFDRSEDITVPVEVVPLLDMAEDAFDDDDAEG